MRCGVPYEAGDRRSHTGRRSAWPPSRSNLSKRMDCKGPAGACHRALDPVAGVHGGKAPWRVQGGALAFSCPAQ